MGRIVQHPTSCNVSQRFFVRASVFSSGPMPDPVQLSQQLVECHYYPPSGLCQDTLLRVLFTRARHAWSEEEDYLDSQHHDL
jgi:hypothetical protein